MPGFPSGQYVDPSYQAELQSEQRGLADLLVDTHRQKKQLKQDTSTQIGESQRAKRRGLVDIGREKKRGLQDIGFQRSDVKLAETRGIEDFGTRLQNLISDYQVRGRQQAQAANAVGLTGGSYSAAAAAARSANLARERQPIDLGVARLQEDTSTQLGRLHVQAGRLRTDTGTEAQRLTQDTHHDIHLAQRSKRRGMKDIVLQKQRGRRELVFSKRDLSRQARFGSNLTRQSLNPMGGQG